MLDVQTESPLPGYHFQVLVLCYLVVFFGVFFGGGVKLLSLEDYQNSNSKTKYQSTNFFDQLIPIFTSNLPQTKDFLEDLSLFVLRVKKFRNFLLGDLLFKNLVGHQDEFCRDLMQLLFLAAEVTGFQ